MAEERNCLIESARIARGKVQDIAGFTAEEYDALIIPGGFGAAKNLSNYAFTGADCTVDEQVAGAIRAMHGAGKPIGALCIAPVLLARLIPDATLTIGQDGDTAANLSAMGAKHQGTMHGEIVIDAGKKIVTTPCYMLDSRVDQIAEGADRLVGAVLKMVVS
jgi:enhancing lycopene biosynthesis protein 2